MSTIPSRSDSCHQPRIFYFQNKDSILVVGASMVQVSAHSNFISLYWKNIISWAGEMAAPKRGGVENSVFVGAFLVHPLFSLMLVPYSREKKIIINSERHATYKKSSKYFIQYKVHVSGSMSNFARKMGSFVYSTFVPDCSTFFSLVPLFS
mgnify:CR=1 FL=1